MFVAPEDQNKRHTVSNFCKRRPPERISCWLSDGIHRPPHFEPDDVVLRSWAPLQLIIFSRIPYLYKAPENAWENHGKTARRKSIVSTQTAYRLWRVSTDDQVHDAQMDKLRAAGCERIFQEHGSGASRARPGGGAARARWTQMATVVSPVASIVAMSRSRDGPQKVCQRCTRQVPGRRSKSARPIHPDIRTGSRIAWNISCRRSAGKLGGWGKPRSRSATSVCERIDRGRFADRLQADGTNAARSGPSDIAKWGSVPGKCRRLHRGRSDSTSAATCISSSPWISPFSLRHVHFLIPLGAVFTAWLGRHLWKTLSA